MQVEDERAAGERMICVDGDRAFIERRDEHRRAATVRKPETQPVTRLDVVAGRQLLTIDLEYEIAAMLAVRARRRNRFALPIADRHADNGVLESGNHRPFADRETKRLLPFRAVEDRAVFERSFVMNLNRVSTTGLLRHRHRSPLFSSSPRSRARAERRPKSDSPPPE